MLSLHVDIRIHPEKRAEFLAAITAQARATLRDEPGCLRFDVIEDVAEPDHFMFYEAYLDDDALAAHKAAPHFEGWAAVRDATVREQRNTVGTHVISLTDPATRDVEPASG